MTKEQNVPDLVEKIIHQTYDDVSISLDRGMERMEERVDGMESRIYSRIADLEERIEDGWQKVADILDTVREDIRELCKIDM